MNNSKQETTIREPVFAGQFYPANATRLREDLRSYFSESSVKVQREKTIAVIAPHAGYVYSGKVAAQSFFQVDPDKAYDNVFLIGSSHTTSFNGASIYAKGNFKTPLGTVPVNMELARDLVDTYSVFSDRTDAHAAEHSLEVQLPFLQAHLKHPFRIIPIIVGTSSVATVDKIATALKPYLNPSNLFVISTDFSHYPSYEDALKVDRITADAILTNQPETFIKTLNDNGAEGYRNLATSICGWTSVLTLMKMSELMPGVKYTAVDYKNSGDAQYYGDKSRVVGYYAIAVTQEIQEKPAGTDTEISYNLTDKDKAILLDIARKTIEGYVSAGKVPDIDASGFSGNILTRAGAFVTLRKNGELRGCIGRFNPDIPLYKVVQEMAVSSATKDTRFSPVLASELPSLTIEISVLTPLKRIRSPEEIVLGKHGIYIKKGFSSGTYLPQVAIETGWSVEDFLGHCARDKAGIGWNGWKNAELYTYEAIVFEEHQQPVTKP